MLAGEEHKTGHGRDTRTHYQVLEAWARERFPVRSVDFRWSAQDYLPADNVPYIGRMLPVYGRLHVVSGGCTHFGCLVAWNAAERTWDCPCHGSRYSYDGQVIQGPAVKNLPARELDQP